MLTASAGSHIRSVVSQCFPCESHAHHTQHSQSAVHPMFTAQFSVPVAHMALAVPSVLDVIFLFEGSCHLVPEGHVWG